MATTVKDVRSKNQASGANCLLDAFSVDPAAGDAIFAVTATFSHTAHPTPTDSMGSTYTQIGSTTDYSGGVAGFLVSFWYTQNVSGGTGVQVTCKGDNPFGFMGGAAWLLTGVPTTAYNSDGQVGTGSATSTPTSPTSSPAPSGGTFFIGAIAGVRGSSDPTFTDGSGWNVTSQYGMDAGMVTRSKTAGNSIYIATEYFVADTATAATWGATATSLTFAAAIASFGDEPFESSSPSASVSPSASTSPSSSASASTSPSSSASASMSPSSSPSASVSLSPSGSPSASVSLSASASPSQSTSLSVSPSSSASRSVSPSPSASPSPGAPDVIGPTGTITRFYSDIDMQDPPDYYGGFKQALLQRTGAGERVLSDLVTGDPIGSTFTFRITDCEGEIRRRLANQTRDVPPANRSGLWVDPLVVRMTTRANRAILGVPYTVFVGPIIDAQPVRPLAWEVTLGDIVSQRILTDQAVHPWRKIGDGFLDQLSAVSTVLDREMPEPIIYGEHRRVRDVDPPSQHGFEVDLTDHYLGIIELLASDRHVWILAGHAVADIPDVNTVDPEGVHNSIIPEEGTDWLIPHHAGWLGNFGANYYDFRSSTYGNYRRYTLIFGNVGTAEPDACAYASGGFPMSIPPAVPLRLMAFVDGVETVGDATGEVIWRREEQYLHFMQNYGTRIGASSYQGPTEDNPTGAWLPSPTWSLFTDGERSVIDEASFAALTVIHEIRIPSDGGSPARAGYVGAAIIGAKPGEIHPITKWISDWNRSTFCCNGWTHLGQFRVVTPHPSDAVKAAAPLFTDAYEIRQGSFNTVIKWNEHHNRTPFKTDIDHPTGRWMTSGIVDQGDSITNYDREIMGKVLELPFAPGITMSTHIAFLHSWIFKHPPRHVILEDTVGPDANGDSLGYLDFGDYIRYKHYAAVGEPDEERLGWIYPIHQVQAGERKVLCEVWDMEDLKDFDVPTVFVPSTNDTCADAVAITNGPDEPYAVTIDTTAHATDGSIIDPPLPFPGIAYHAAWWTYTPPANGSLFLTTVHSRYDTQMAVLTGTCGGDDWVLEEFNDNDGILSTSILEFAVTSGVPLHILVYGYGPDDGGSLTFGLLFTAA